MTALEEQAEYTAAVLERIASALERIATCLELSIDGERSFAVKQAGAWITREDRP